MAIKLARNQSFTRSIGKSVVQEKELPFFSYMPREKRNYRVVCSPIKPRPIGNRPSKRICWSNEAYARAMVDRAWIECSCGRWLHEECSFSLSPSTNSKFCPILLGKINIMAVSSSQLLFFHYYCFYLCIILLLLLFQSHVLQALLLQF